MSPLSFGLLTPWAASTCTSGEGVYEAKIRRGAGGRRSRDPSPRRCQLNLREAQAASMAGAPRAAPVPAPLLFSTRRSVASVAAARRSCDNVVVVDGAKQRAERAPSPAAARWRKGCRWASTGGGFCVQRDSPAMGGTVLTQIVAVPQAGTKHQQRSGLLRLPRRFSLYIKFRKEKERPNRPYEPRHAFSRTVGSSDKCSSSALKRAHCKGLRVSFRAAVQIYDEPIFWRS